MGSETLPIPLNDSPVQTYIVAFCTEKETVEPRYKRSDI